MRLDEALGQIGEIHRQLVRTQLFRGFRAVPVAGSGALAVAAAGLQPVVVREPAHQLGDYLLFWTGVALVAGAICSIELVRSLLGESSLRREEAREACARFLPCIGAGALLTAVVGLFAPERAELLPALWALLYSQGIFASLSRLPSGTLWVGVFYLIGGLVAFVLAKGEWAFSPWAMALPFGIGQFWAGLVLYFGLERQR